MKEQIKARWKRVKTWVSEHKKAVILGVALLGVGAIGAVVSANKGEESYEENEDYQKALEAAKELDEEEELFKNIDRYTISKDMIDQLPPGSYNVFDGYENERVNYVIEEKESMET